VDVSVALSSRSVGRAARSVVPLSRSCPRRRPCPARSVGRARPRSGHPNRDSATQPPRRRPLPPSPTTSCLFVARLTGTLLAPDEAGIRASTTESDRFRPRTALVRPRSGLIRTDGRVPESSHEYSRRRTSRDGMGGRVGETGERRSGLSGERYSRGAEACDMRLAAWAMSGIGRGSGMRAGSWTPSAQVVLTNASTTAGSN